MEKYENNLNMEKYENELNLNDVLKLFLDNVIDNCLNEYYQELLLSSNSNTEVIL